MTDSRPIGLFDSGVGGVPVLAEVRRLLPAERLIYLADTANFPYGPRSAEEIQGLACKAAQRLIERGVKLIVVPCHTASTMALAHLREHFELPFVGMVPPVKPASALSRSGRVGVLATQGTVQAAVLADLIEEFANGASVSTIAAPELADLVERGADLEVIRPVLEGYIRPLVESGSDVIVLGCTHYFFLRGLVESMVPTDIAVIDAAEPVARRVAQVLGEKDMLNGDGAGSVEYMTSGDRRRLDTALSRWRQAGFPVP